MNRRRPINHGTTGGYRAHFRHGEPVCEPCRDANRRANGHQPFHSARCGTRSGYGRHLQLGEDCAQCRAANTAAMAAERKERHARGLPPDSPHHGTLNGYETYGCRCAPCKAAKSAQNRMYRERRKAVVKP